MSPGMKLVWLYFLLRKRLGLAKIGQPPRAPAVATKRQLRGLSFSSEQIDGFTVNRVSPKEVKRRVVYLHGGGYVSPIASQHWQLITRIARDSQAEVIVPRYGLSPKHKVDEALSFLERVRLATPIDKPLVLMGDSAGGGLALTLAQSTWKEISLLTLISPWVDSEFGSDSELFEQRDPWLNSSSLRYIATVWSGVGDFRRLEVSPLRNSMNGLPQTVVYAGDFELFYPDLLELVKKMQEQGVLVELVEQPGGLHVFPLIPVPEGKKAQDHIIQTLLGI